MAIVNRDLDSSEQRKTLQCEFGVTGTGLTLLCVQIPVAAELQAVRAAAVGLSGAPTIAFTIGRFIAGTGFTSLTGGATLLTLTAFGTSGIQTMAVNASGSSLTALQAGDVLQLTTAGTNAAVAALSVAFVIKELVDIKNQYNAF